MWLVKPLNLLLDRRVWKRVTGQLFDCQLVEGHVIVVGVDYPISPMPHFPQAVVW
jgi:hypothetical protein